MLKLMCVDNQGWQDRLEVDKEYDGYYLNELRHYVVIPKVLNNKGDACQFFANRFVVVDDVKNTKGSALDHQVGGNHYKNLPIQPLVYCQKNELNYCESNVIKYVTRHKDKGGRMDLEKAIENLQILIELEYDDS